MIVASRLSSTRLAKGLPLRAASSGNIGDIFREAVNNSSKSNSSSNSSSSSKSGGGRSKILISGQDSSSPSDQKRDSGKSSNRPPRSYSSNNNSYNNYKNDWKRNETPLYPHRPSKRMMMDAAFDYLYGISVCHIALKRNFRQFSEIFIQDGMDVENKKDSAAASEILSMCESMGIKQTIMSKHDLNMFTDNRPHQGFVLMASPIEVPETNCMDPVTASLTNSDDNDNNNNSSSSTFKCVLALDEVSDPQNLGALLRTSLFLGVDEIVICSKNSSALSATVSKASSGALEVLGPNRIKSTDNMMDFLEASKSNGWQVIGTAINKKSVISIDEVPLDKPTIIVLGNEGAGIRTNVLKKCDHLVMIQGKTKTSLDSTPENSMFAFDSIVESLNVSVTGGILLHNVISRIKA